jgi:hypothetical protein
MRSVSEIAKDLRITPQAVYKKVHNQLKNELKGHVHKDGKGKTLIDEEGEQIIKGSLNRDSQPFKQPDSQPGENQLNNEFVLLLKDQLKVKDCQIQDLMNQNGSLLDKIENMQVLLKNEQEKTAYLTSGPHTESEEQKKSTQGFWQRIFSKV